MNRCANCSYELPEGAGLKQCPQCGCELGQAGLPPLPGFDNLQSPDLANRSQTLFGLSGVSPAGAGGARKPITRSQGFPIPASHRPATPKRPATDRLPGLPRVSADQELDLSELDLPSTPKKPGRTGAHHVIDFGHGSGDDGGADDLPALSLDLPAISETKDALSSPALDLPSPSADLPVFSSSLPAVGATLPAAGASLPVAGSSLPAVSSTLPLPSPGGPGPGPVPPTPPGTARYQRPKNQAPKRHDPQSTFDSLGMTMPAVDEVQLHASIAAGHSGAVQTRSVMRHAQQPQGQALKDDGVLGLGDLELGLEPAGPVAGLPDPMPSAANDHSPLAPPDLPDASAPLDLDGVAPSQPVAQAPQAANAASPAPKSVPQGPKKWPIYAGAGVLSLALIGVGSWQLGLFDSPEPAAPVAKVEKKPKAKKPSKQDPAALAAMSGRLTERSKGFLAALHADKSIDALALAKAEKDPLGMAEASLYYALQNPDPRSWDQPWVRDNVRPLTHWKQNRKPFVQRVFALSQMLDGQLDAAKATLEAAKNTPEGAKDPLITLYQGLIAHREGQTRPSIELTSTLARLAPTLTRAELLSHAYAQDLAPFAKIRPNVAAWEALVTQAESGDATSESAFSIAYRLLELGRWASAAKIGSAYAASSKSAPDKRRWKAFLTRLDGVRGNYDAVIHRASTAMDDSMNAPDTAAMLWEARFARSQYKQLAQDLAKWLGTHPSDIDARIMQARNFAAQGRGSLGLMLLHQIDHHLLTGKPLPAPLLAVGDDEKFKQVLAKAKGSDPEQLMSISPKLAGVQKPVVSKAQASALARGEILARRMAVRAAVAAFETAAQLSPLDTQAPILQARMLVKAGQFPRAMAVLEGAFAGASRDISAKATLARASWLAEQSKLARQAGKRKLARKYLSKAFALAPQEPSVALARAQMLQSSGREDMAEAAYIALMARTGDMPGLMTPMTQIYLRKGELEKLDKLLSPVIEREDASLDILLSGASLRLAQNKLLPALALADRALKRAPKNWKAHLSKAQILLARGEVQAAQAQLREASPRDPQADYELWLGKVKDAQGDLQGAYGHYRLASSLDKSNWEPRVLQAKILARRGSARKAISLLKPMMNNKSLSADAYLAMGIAHRDLRKPRKAVGFFRRAQAKMPNSYVAFYEEGRIASNNNQHRQVIRAMDKALAAHTPTMPQRIRLDALRRLGRAYLEQGDLDRAEETLSRYLIEAPQTDPGRSAVERMLRSL